MLLPIAKFSDYTTDKYTFRKVIRQCVGPLLVMVGHGLTPIFWPNLPFNIMHTGAIGLKWILSDRFEMFSCRVWSSHSRHLVSISPELLG